MEKDEVEKFVCVSVNKQNAEETAVENGKYKCYYIKENHVGMKDNPALTQKLNEIFKKEKPDIIDVQGAEFSIPADFLNCNYECPAVITLQGFPFEIVKAFYLGFPKSQLLFGRSVHDWKHLSGIIEKKYFLALRGKKTKKILKNFKYALGRTSWDNEVVKKVNPDIKYYKCNRILRSDFYGRNWSLENSKPHYIFGMQGNLPAKGLHIALEIVKKLKEKYSDVKLIVPGYFEIDESPSNITGFAKYIKEKINEYGIADNIEFTGRLNPEEMISRQMECRVFLQYSLQENSPNSLAEAQAVGMPCVASKVGGTVDYVEHDKSGLLFECLDVDKCVEEIESIFENDELALRLSRDGQRAAFERHDAEKNTEILLNSYVDIINDYKTQNKG